MWELVNQHHFDEPWGFLDRVVLDVYSLRKGGKPGTRWTRSHVTQEMSRSRWSLRCVTLFLSRVFTNRRPKPADNQSKAMRVSTVNLHETQRSAMCINSTNAIRAFSSQITADFLYLPRPAAIPTQCSLRFVYPDETHHNPDHGRNNPLCRKPEYLTHYDRNQRHKSRSRNSPSIPHRRVTCNITNQVSHPP